MIFASHLVDDSNGTFFDTLFKSDITTNLHWDEFPEWGDIIEKYSFICMIAPKAKISRYSITQQQVKYIFPFIYKIPKGGILAFWVLISIWLIF